MKKNRWVNDGEKDLAVPIEEAKSYIQKGYKLGRIGIRDRKWVHDGNGHEKCVSNDDAIRLTYLGWFLGRVENNS